MMAEWPVQWRGAWIWDKQPEWSNIATAHPVDPADRDAFVMFRRTLALENVPHAAPFRITADGRYVLWVNGRELSRGPIRSEPGILYWDEVDLAPVLTAGPNVIAVLARHYGAPTPWWSPAPSFSHLGRGGVVAESDAVPDATTGAEWKSMRGPWRQTQPLFFGAPNEDLDGSRLAADWTGVEYDDSRWAPARILTGEGWWGEPGDQVLRPPGTPFTLLLGRPLPHMTDIEVTARPLIRGRLQHEPPPGPKRKIIPQDPIYRSAGAVQVTDESPSLPVHLGPDEAVIFDFGGMTIGLPVVRVESEGPNIVTLRSGEILDNGMPADPNRQWAHRRECGPGTTEIQPFEIAGMRYLMISGDQPLTVQDVRLRERRYPLDGTGAFSCDDASLTDIWTMGVRTLELCSTDAFLDCPGREQRAWLGDAYVHGLLTYVSSRDHRIALHALDLAAQARRHDGLLGMISGGDIADIALTIPDYSLHWIRGLCRAWDYSGDRGFVERLFANARSILDWFWNFVEDGVLQPVPGWTFVDWWPIKSEGVLGSVQGLLLLALQDHAHLAEQLDQPAVARHSRERAEVLLRGFEYFIDRNRGTLVESPESGLATQHVLAVATLAGAIEPELASRMLERAMSPEVARYPQPLEQNISNWTLPADFDRTRHVVGTQPFFAHWLHQAMARVGRHDLILESIRRWTKFSETGDGTIWEYWTEEGLNGSHCHAWSATPTFDLTTHFLGVSPSAPGFGRAGIRPWFGPLQQLAGTVPTPHGVIRVDLHRTENGPGGQIELPPGITGELEFGEWPELGVTALGPGSTTVSQSSAARLSLTRST